jgi:hypothetical protein
MLDVLNALVVFAAEHRRCGDRDGGRDDTRVWLACSCGAQVVHQVRLRRRLPRVAPQVWRSESRIVNPRALAVLRLITSSDLTTADLQGKNTDVAHDAS